MLSHLSLLALKEKTLLPNKCVGWFIPDKLRPGSSSTLPERSASSSPAGNSQLHCAPQESTSSDESVDVILDVDESLSESSPSTSSDSLGDDELMSLPVDKALVRAMLSHLVEKVDNADNAGGLLGSMFIFLFSAWACSVVG
ncbi:hypothetical protein U1Q18_017549 [Sarracenia purpurea var. burkii]